MHATSLYVLYLMNYEWSNILFVFPYLIEISKNKILISRCFYRQSSRIKQMNKYYRFLLHASFYHALSVCFKSIIQSGRSLFLSKIKIHLTMFLSTVIYAKPLLHRNVNIKLYINQKYLLLGILVVWFYFNGP
jgi:hypothetical protein